MNDPLDFTKIPEPRFMPGYKGHVPNMKFEYGSTFGNLTASYLRRTRNKHLTSSTTNLNKGGVFCTFNSGNGSDFCLTRPPQNDIQVWQPPYNLTSQDTCTRMKQHDFVKKKMQHRAQYLDTSGYLTKVPIFHVPKDFETKETFLFSQNGLGCHHSGVPW